MKVEYLQINLTFCTSLLLLLFYYRGSKTVFTFSQFLYYFYFKLIFSKVVELLIIFSMYCGEKAKGWV